MEKPMNEPKVKMYSTLIDQVCLSLKIANWRLILGLMLPGIKRSSPRVLSIISGIAIHILRTPKPIGLGKYRYKPTTAVIKLMPYRPRILLKALNGVPGLGVMGIRLFIPNQLTIINGIKNTSQIQPAF